jgi:hypothetical protein
MGDAQSLSDFRACCRAFAVRAALGKRYVPAEGTRESLEGTESPLHFPRLALQEDIIGVRNDAHVRNVSLNRLESALKRQAEENHATWISLPDTPFATRLEAWRLRLLE